MNGKDDSFLFPAHSVPAQQHGIRSASVFHCKNSLLLINPGYRVRRVPQGCLRDASVTCFHAAPASFRFRDRDRLDFDQRSFGKRGHFHAASGWLSGKRFGVDRVEDGKVADVP